MYELKLLLIMQIYSMIFIIQLKLYLDEDFYYRFRSINSSLIIDENRSSDFYKIEKIFEKKIVNNIS